MKTNTRKLVKRVLGEEPMTTTEIYSAIKNLSSIGRYGDKRPRVKMPALQELGSILGKSPEFIRVNDRKVSPALWVYRGEEE